MKCPVHQIRPRGSKTVEKASGLLTQRHLGWIFTSALFQAYSLGKLEGLASLSFPIYTMGMAVFDVSITRGPG